MMIIIIGGIKTSDALFVAGYIRYSYCAAPYKNTPSWEKKLCANIMCWMVTWNKEKLILILTD